MSRFQTWFISTRPWSWSMSAISVSVGATLAAIGGPFHWGYYFLTVVGMILLHTAGNMTNDYFDVKSGVDKVDVKTAAYRPHPLLHGDLKPGPYMAFIILLYALTLIIGIYLAVVRGPVVLILGLLGILGAWTYTGPPFKYKYKGLGEFFVFLMWGPMMICGSYYVQAQEISTTALLVSLPFGALVALVLLANNLRDMAHDGREKIRTVPLIIGQANGLRLYIGLIAAAYLAVTLMALFGPLPAWSLIVLLSVPLAVPLVKALKEDIPADMDAQTAKLDTGFGVLLVVSLVLGVLF